MTDGFITPGADELSEAGLIDDSNADAPPDDDRSAWADTFKERWKRVGDMADDEVLDWAERVGQDHPQRGRELLALVVAQDLGYRRLLRRSTSLIYKALWEILDAQSFGELGGNARLALARLAESTQPGRPAFHPMAALACLGLWRHGDIDQQDRAVALLGCFALPDEPDWMYELVGRFGDFDPDEPADLPGNRQLIDLAGVQLQANFWDSAALLSGLYFVAEFAPNRAGSPMGNLIKACDRAADEHPAETAAWLDVMADAAMGGQLVYGWLEKPMRAAIRLNVDRPERAAKLRAWHDKRPYDADHSRLQDLYEADLDDYADADDPRRQQARQALLDEVDQTAQSHPVRAQRLLELMVMRDHPRRVGTFGSRLSYALDALVDKPRLEPAERRLVELYVANYHIEPHAVRTVRRLAGRLDWQDRQQDRQPAPDVDALDMYLVVSDYERAFEHLTCKFDGVTLEHADKDAAARVKFFIEKRLDPNRLTEVVRKLFTPLEWIGAGLTNLDLVSGAVERALGVFRERVQTVDLTDDVLAEYRQAGVDVDTLEDVAELNMAQVDALLKNRRTMRLVLSAVAGGLSGGLAPFSWAALSLADAPILLGLTADICSRFCWYYGFDPREYPDLPMEIMAVALGGSNPAAIEPMLLRQNLREYAVRKSVMVGAVARGSVTQMAGRTLGSFVRDHLGTKATNKIGQSVNGLVKRTVTKNLQRRAAEAVPSKTLPIVGALLGASLNVALIYDVCEAAQAVLTDRFLERKYPDWIRKFDLGEPAEAAKPR